MHICNREKKNKKHSQKQQKGSPKWPAYRLTNNLARKGNFNFVLLFKPKKVKKCFLWAILLTFCNSIENFSLFSSSLLIHKIFSTIFFSQLISCLLLWIWQSKPRKTNFRVIYLSFYLLCVWKTYFVETCELMMICSVVVGWLLAAICNFEGFKKRMSDELSMTMLMSDERLQVVWMNLYFVGAIVLLFSNLRLLARDFKANFTFLLFI